MAKCDSALSAACEKREERPAYFSCRIRSVLEKESTDYGLNGRFDATGRKEREMNGDKGRYRQDFRKR